MTGNILKDFKIDNMKKIELKETVKYFSVNYTSVNTNE